MIPELGHFALILALLLALMQAALPIIGSYRSQSLLLVFTKPLLIGQCVFIGLSFLCLTYSFIANDFSVAYVAQNSNSSLPLIYRICAVWGAHEGSMLLWVLILSGWSVALACTNRMIPTALLARVVSVLGFISVGFLLFLLFTSNPFLRLLPEIPDNGQDLNPLLQDPGFIIHPPMLYMGYVGFAIAFAFAIAALLEGRLDKNWVRWMRPWTLIAWCFLTFGITLGSWWAYRELGWGGWWFWDPVENASFLPWLVGTALIHSLIVSEKRDAFKLWSILLAITAFSLSLLGTFLVRSGVLTSVHAFASDPTRGIFMLLFLSLVVGGSFILYSMRFTSVQQGGEFSWISKETFLLSNNVLLMVTMLTVLLGTLYPLIVDALGWGKISVGPPYFNTVFVPLVSALFLLMGIAPHCQWRNMLAKVLLKPMSIIFIFSLAAAVVFPWLITHTIKFPVVVGLLLAFWLITTLVYKVSLSLRDKRKIDYGMLLGHLGIAFTIIGITVTANYRIERDVRITLGEQIAVGDYQFRFNAITAGQGPNYETTRAEFIVTKNDKLITTLYPEKRFYPARQNMMTDAAIAAGIWKDLYIALGEPLSERVWAVRIYYKPFIRWIWLGGLLMLTGGLFAAFRSGVRKEI